MRFLLFLTALFLSATSEKAETTSKPCAQRSFGKDSFVCVCNEKYCDDFGSQQLKPEAGKALLFVSDRSRDRLTEYKLDWKLRPTRHDNRTLLKIAKPSTDKSTKNRQIIGFGAAFTDATAVNMYKMSPPLVNHMIQDYFGENGLKYTVGRVPIGGTDFSTHPYTYNDIDENGEDFDLKHFALAPEDVHYKIPLIQMAQKLVPSLKLFGSPWSAPKWMKTNHNLNGKGELRGDVKGKYYQTWAKYFVKFLQAYASNHIQFWGLTIQNEPYDGLLDNFVFNCMAMSPQKQRDFIKLDLWPALNGSGFHDVKLMIADEQRPFIRQYADVILQDEETAKLVAGVAVHWYMDTYTSPEILSNLTRDYHDHFVLPTEACEGSNPFEKEKVILGSWQRAENYAFNIIQDLNYTSSGWIDWNMVLDPQGGPNWSENFVDAPIIVNASYGEYYKQPMYYALAHFSRFIRPGSVKIESETEVIDQNDAVESVFFHSDDGKQTIGVLLNRFESHIPVRIEDASKHDLVLDIEVQPKSIITVVW